MERARHSSFYVMCYTSKSTTTTTEWQSIVNLNIETQWDSKILAKTTIFPWTRTENPVYTSILRLFDWKGKLSGGGSCGDLVKKKIKLVKSQL